MYEMKTRIRYSEADENLILTVPAMVNLLQDCSGFHSADCGYPVSRLLGEHTGWYILSWQIDIDDLPRLGDYVTVRTAASGYKGLFTLRDFTISDADDKTLVRAHSIWILMDLSTGKPSKVTEDMKNAYGPIETVEGDWSGRKIRLGQSAEKPQGSFVVSRNSLDANRHMNNERYIEEARAVLPGGFRISGIRTEYRKQALLGDEIMISEEQGEGFRTEILRNPDNEILAVVRFLGTEA